MGSIKDYWTLDQIGGGGIPLYVYLCPPGAALSSIRFSLAGLDAEVRARIGRIRRGDRVPEDLIRALEALPGHDSFRGSFSTEADVAKGPRTNRDR
jgi:hypothetical protein